MDSNVLNKCMAYFPETGLHAAPVIAMATELRLEDRNTNPCNPPSGFNTGLCSDEYLECALEQQVLISHLIIRIIIVMILFIFIS
jgi:hypothetical protein